MALSFSELHISKASSYKSIPFIHLQQLYEFEFSPVTGSSVNKDGLYDQEIIRKEWSPHGVDIYILYHESNPLGFAVVNLAGIIDKSPETKDIAEFFILPEYRGKGIGEWFAHAIFDLYTGTWEVRQLSGLDKARSFWIKTIDKYTCGNFKETKLSDDQWKGSIQRFKSRF